MDSAHSRKSSPFRNRRWCRFGLWTLLLGVSIGCIGFAFAGAKIRQWRTQKSTEVKWARRGAISRHKNGRLVGLTFEQLVSNTDQRLAFLGEVPDLRGLDLTGTDVTDAGLINLKGLSQLEVLRLAADRRITDAGLANLAGLKQLEGLDLYGSPITDVGLIHLADVDSLRRLILSETQVTDAGLAHLEKLTQLEGLCVRDTQVTEVGVKKLKKVLPNCRVYFGSDDGL